MQRWFIVCLLALAACAKHHAHHDGPPDVSQPDDGDPLPDPVCQAYQALIDHVCVDLVSSVTASAGTLAFDPSLFAYDLATGLQANAIALTPTTAVGVVLTVNGATAGSGAASTIALPLGETVITLAASLGDVSVSYAITVHRDFTSSLNRYLKASNAQENAGYGTSVAIDGDTIVVGAPYESSDASATATTSNTNATQSGAAYVLVRENGQWRQQAFVKPTYQIAATCGNVVGISGDTLMVACRDENVGGKTRAGAIHVYVRDGDTWTLQQTLVSDHPRDLANFGWAAAIEGDQIVVGAPYESNDGTENLTNEAGAVYVFERADGVWSQSGFLQPNDGQYAFGKQVAIAGTTLTATDLYSSKAYLFSREAGVWTRQPDLVPADTSAFVGLALAMTEDTVAIGGVGSVAVFERTAAGWAEQPRIAAPNPPASTVFGTKLAIDGNVMVIGDTSDSGDATSTVDDRNSNARDSGAVYVYAKTGEAWSFIAFFKASNGASQDQLGDAVAVSGDTVVAAATWEGGDATSTLDATNDNQPLSGAAYVFGP